MFEEPAAKRVKRSDIFDNVSDSDSQAGSDDNTDAQRPLQYRLDFDIVENVTVAHKNEAIEKGQEDDEAGFAFNLFRPQQPAANVVKIRSPSVASEAEPGLSRGRPASFYFTDRISSQQRSNQLKSFAVAAVSGLEIQQASDHSWPGMAMSWRLVSLPAHNRQVVMHRTAKIEKSQKQAEMTEVVVKRARLSKKRRDLARSKAVKRQRIIDETKSKEEHEREKRNKKNREQKLKRRAKERQEKEERRKSGISESANDHDNTSD